MTAKSMMLLGCVLLVLLLPACVSIDSRIESEIINKDATQNMAGNFANKASYWSKKFPARDNLAEMLGVPAEHADRVQVSLDKNGVLTMRWFTENVETASRVFAPNQLTVSKDGAIELVTKSSVETVGNSTSYWTWNSRLFININGDLVMIKSFREAGVGLMVIIPFAGGSYSKQLSVFPRMK